MTSRTLRLTALIAAVLVALLAVAGATYAIQQRRVDSLEQQLAEKDRRLSEAVLEAQVAADAVETETVVPAETPPDSSATEASQPPSKTERPESVEQFAFVTKAVRGSSGDVRLTLDYAEFLTGEDAAGAALGDGEESPPPNDYYISNTNPKLRTLSVATGAIFTMAYETPDDTRAISSAEFADAISNNTEGAADSAFWFTIENGRIISAKQQWTP